MVKVVLLLPSSSSPPLGGNAAASWAADNGNGTYSNPLFYDEFSDPDMIRVGADYYLTGTTMHAMPGLPILHSRDLVNWRIIGYAFDRLDLGPDFRLEDGKEIYGQGIWAPSFRYHNGTYYIFANVNRFGLQVFRATDPRGPWKHNRIEQGLHDLSVLFDDDGKIYAVYGARTIRIVELNQELTALVPGTDRVLIEPEQGMGEGSHIYKIKGKYYIVSAIPGAHVPMKCARADQLDRPWEVKTISEEESLGIGQGYRLQGSPPQAPPFEITPPNPAERAQPDLHQGGIIDTVTGEWWGFSMQDHNSVGRLTSLSPVTWVDGWPYFGLPGNLTRTPSIWVKPEHRARRAHHFSLRSQRRFLRAEAAAGLAVESSAGRYQVVADRAPRLSPPAFASRARFLVGAKLADAARHRAGIDRHHGPGRLRPESRRCRRTGAAEPAVCVDRGAARGRRICAANTTIRPPGSPSRAVAESARQASRALQLRHRHRAIQLQHRRARVQADRRRIARCRSSSRRFKASATRCSTTTRAAPRRSGGLRRLHRRRAAAARIDQADSAIDQRIALLQRERLL